MMSRTVSRTACIAVLALLLPALSAGHGTMETPTTRGSMWRFPSKYPQMASPADYNDNGLNAGGPSAVRADYPVLRYGMCGDRYTDPVPRAHETGGTWGRFNSLGAGAIAECYAPGATIDIRIRITAHHRGFFQFQLCVPGNGNDESEACFENGHLLEQANGGGTDYQLPDLGSRVYEMQYVLPPGVRCDGSNRCVLRWYWLSGNSPATVMKEEFWNCADIQISPDCSSTPTPLVTQTPSPSPPVTQTPSPSPPVTQTPTPSVTHSPTPSPPVRQTLASSPVSSPSPTTSSPPTTSSSPTTSSIPCVCAMSPSHSPSHSPTASVPPGNNCACNEGHCPTGTCDNCLFVYGDNGGRRSCNFGWQKVHCEQAGSGYEWCGASHGAN